ncbi:MAG: Uncharacterized protein F083_2885 [bacterium F083]|nr:MAG: Uncharacterized protein F083_2885 [bacterium F083]
MFKKAIIVLIASVAVVIGVVFYTSQKSETENKEQQKMLPREGVEESFPITTHVLSNTTWEYDTSYDSNIEVFTDSVLISTCIRHSDGKTYKYRYLYYLSDYIPSKFDSAKVGVLSSGKYLIRHNESGTFNDEIVWLDLSELHLKGPDDNVFVYKRK